MFRAIGSWLTDQSSKSISVHDHGKANLISRYKARRTLVGRLKFPMRDVNPQPTNATELIDALETGVGGFHVSSNLLPSRDTQ